jgi:putative tryptophan/tyrosine transport system substrate-binding protein
MHSLRRQSWKMLVTSTTLQALVGLACGLLATLAADAQPPGRVPRVGVLTFGGPGTPGVEAFRQGLRELGYVEGTSIALEFRHAERKPDLAPEFAAELVRLPVDVLVTTGSEGIRALQRETSTIPIVGATIGDAVDAGFVKSLARPGGNVTGLSFLSTELSAKRLELLKEALPALTRVAVIRDPRSLAGQVRATETTARSLGLRLQILEVRGPGEFEGAFAAAKEARAEGLSVLGSPILSAHRKALVELAAKHRLPAIYFWREFVEDGGLMSYAPSLSDLWRRTATYVDKILKGAKPADLPVEQPTKFELVVNLRTAKALGLTIPPSILVRADQVIE